VEKYKVHYPWVTTDMLKQRVKRACSKLTESHTASLTNPTLPNRTNTNTDREKEKANPIKGGRPKGSTVAAKALMQSCIDEAKSEICDLYKKEKYEDQHSKPAYGSYKRIFNKVKKERNLPDNFYFPYTTAFRRIKNDTTLDAFAVPIGNRSPLHAVEEDFVNIFIMLGKIGSPVSCGHGLKLINDMISGTIHQKRLIQYKKDRGLKQSEDEMKRVGTKYWYSFLSRYKNRIVSKKGRRFELNRSKWTSYKNFYKMYEGVEEEMLDAGVAEKLPVPVYMDENGIATNDRMKIKGMKVKSLLKKPDMCIVLDEVGSNLCMVNDGHIAGKRYVCQRGDEPKTPATKKDKHFTCLGLTALDGQPVMCVIIIDSKKRDLLVETGVDTECARVDNSVCTNDDEFSYLERNLGTDSQYPGGPVCNFKNKEIPCMVEFTSGGGMTGSILSKIFKTLDKLEVYKEDREAGCRPFILLDGHQTRFDLEFLEYMNNPAHPWSVCIGVPYGTSLWQVGDSTEQNGNFKVRLNQKKELLLGRRLDTMMKVELVSTDIIPLVNYAWSRSFAVVESNKKAIWERGWFPLNRNLLLHPSLRETMTEGDIQAEIDEGLHPMHDGTLENTPPTQSAAASSQNQIRTPNMRISRRDASTNEASSSTSAHIDLNFGQGLSQYYIKQVIKKADLDAARESIQDDKKKGKDMIEQLNAVTRVTASSLMKADTFVLGEHVRDAIKSRVVIKREEEEEKKRKEEEAIKEQQVAAKRVLKKNEGREISDWTIADLKALVKPSKVKADGAMPTTKAGLIELHNKCVSRNQRGPLMGQLTGGNTSETNRGLVLPQIEVEQTVQEEEAVFRGKSEV
jgi:hypothetical protein